MERKEEAKLFFVTGRIPGDGDDTTEVIAAPEEGAACAAFKSELYERRCGKPLPLSGSEVTYVTGSGEIGAVLPNGLVRLTGAVIDACPEGTPKAAAPIDWEVVGVPMKAHGISGDIAPDETESQFLARTIDELAIDATMPRAIKQVIEQCGGDVWGRCSDYARADWEYEVSNGDSILGYWEWVIHQAESDSVDLEGLHA